MDAPEKCYVRDDMVVRRSNDFLYAKYKMPLLANKIMAIALCKIEERNAEASGGGFVVHLYPGEINALLHRPASSSHNIYRDIRQAGIAMNRVQIVIDDAENHRLEIFTLIPNVEYENGVLTIKFNESIGKYIQNLRGSFTQTEIAVLSRFRKASTYRLYELLSKEKYRIPKSPNGVAEVSFGISELRFMIGLADVSEDGVRKAMAGKKEVDWDYLYDNVVKEKLYDGWTSLRRYVIEPAIEEMEETCDITFSYATVNAGHNRVKGIKFFIRRNDKIDKDDEADVVGEPDGQMDFCAVNGLYDEFEGFNGMTKPDIAMLFGQARGDCELVRDAINAACRAGYVKNWMGWLVSYIQRKGQGYDDPVEAVDGSAEKAQRINEAREGMRSPEVVSSVWERIKEKEEYPGFLRYMHMKDGELERILPVADCVGYFTSWLTGGGDA